MQSLSSIPVNAAGSSRPAFSPDGQWVAYTVVGENYLTHVRLYSFVSGHSSDLADRLIQTDNPTFGGDNLLYFTASIDAGPSRSPLDMSTDERPLRKAIYAAVLAADGHSPLAPKSGDEEPLGKSTTDHANDNGAGKGDERRNGKQKDNGAGTQGEGTARAGRPEAADGATPPPKRTRIDLTGLSQRFVPIPYCGTQLRPTPGCRRRGLCFISPASNRARSGSRPVPAVTPTQSCIATASRTAPRNCCSPPCSASAQVSTARKS